MKCPFCGLDNTRVIDSRPADDNSSYDGEDFVTNVEKDLLHMRE